MGPVELGPALSGGGQPDYVDSPIADQRAQIGERGEDSRPERVGARPLGLCDPRHAKFHHLTRSYRNAKAVTDPALQRIGQRRRDQHLVRCKVLTQGGLSDG